MLELNIEMSYEEVTGKLGQKLGLEPRKLRLTQSVSQVPEPVPVCLSVHRSLKDMLLHSGQICYILFYEVFDVPLGSEHLEKDQVNFCQ